ncbi:elongin-A [Synchiropus splendidus]|uniref:elongin-A n=1 Tax=Synchiropus splendidus TaxID=270530 RepID=UPI00237DCF1C|nr:elongin-A [Synchiropus splendidus]XP_053719339.1 elongin-A [Synchiropus splendidus]
MAEDLLLTVERLNSRLLESPEPRKLIKTLKKLEELPMTMGILVETGVGKTVNSFRKHEVAAEMARNLVARWKKLVPQSTARPSNNQTREISRSHTHSEKGARQRAREPSPVEEPSYMEEEPGYHADYSPSPPQQQQYSPQHGGYQSEEYESPRAATPPPSPPRHKTKPNKERNVDEAQRQRHVQRFEDGARSERQRGEGRSGDRDQKKHSKKSSETSPSKRLKKSDGQQRETKDSPPKDEDDFETPTMSFESFLTYDSVSPVKKKKKPPSSSTSGRPSHSASSSTSSSRQSTSASTLSSPSSKASKVNGAQSSKRSHSSSSSAAAVPEKRRKVAEAVPSLPEIPLPAIQPNYRPLPSIDLTPLSPQRRKGPIFTEEEDAGFTGKRFNSKMVVYSGSKTAYLPRMMTLYEQCIRVLQNNIDSIAEVGGVPFDILEPVLERCTPEQLFRIEQSNQWFTEDSDDLWMRHCKRDFKRESPQEYESWREMYLRLYEEREARLKMLTQNISSAHANQPKRRQAKIAFVNSVAKPPRDVRRRQEKFGTSNGSTAASVAAAAPIKIRPATTFVSSSSLSSQQDSTPSSSSRAPTALPAAGSSAREKPQIKKIAPMMAKTIKAFKNRFSRR